MDCRGVARGADRNSIVRERLLGAAGVGHNSREGWSESYANTTMSAYLTAKELALLLRIKERKVYELAANGEVPCSRAMGKLLFPRDEVEAWIASSRSGPSKHSARAPTRPNVVLGSHDPLLDWALRESRCGLASYFDGSLDGLDRFSRSEGIAVGLHLLDVESNAWNVPEIERLFAAEPSCWWNGPGGNAA